MKDVAINIPDSKDASLITRLPLAIDRPVIGYGVAVILAAVAWFLRYEIGDGLPPGFPYLTFFPAVIFTAFFFGARPGILCAAICGVLAWFFFIEPQGSFGLSFNSGLALAFYIFIVGVDIVLIDWMQKANRRLFEERERSELLFSELQHRVGNNLQMVASLIALQRNRLDDEAAKTALDEASQRLGLIGKIHRQLYDPAGSLLGLAAHIREITQEVIGATGRDEIEFEFQANADASLSPDKAIPVALIVTEALNNALEHGLPVGVDRGRISVRIEPRGERVAVIIEDDGIGPPDGFDFERSSSLGLRIVRTLTGSLAGEFSLSPSDKGSGAIAMLTISSDGPSPDWS